MRWRLCDLFIKYIRIDVVDIDDTTYLGENFVKISKSSSNSSKQPCRDIRIAANILYSAFIALKNSQPPRQSGKNSLLRKVVHPEYDIFLWCECNIWSIVMLCSGKACPNLTGRYSQTSSKRESLLTRSRQSRRN